MFWMDEWFVVRLILLSLCVYIHLLFEVLVKYVAKLTLHTINFLILQNERIPSFLRNLER